MKRLLLSILLILPFALLAQTPQAFKYQAVARDASGGILSNQNVQFRIQILQGSPVGNSVYTETHATSTNNFGLVNLELGNGLVAAGDFSMIDWGTGTYFVQIELDAEGGNDFKMMGTSQLLSVPYALHASTADNVDDADADPENELQTIVSGDANNQLIAGTDGGAMLKKDDDSERTFTKDLLLAQSLCQCEGKITSFLVNSALSSGYNVEDLVDAGVSNSDLVGAELEVRDLLDGGISIEDLLTEGVPIEDFLAAEVSISDLIASGAGILDLFDSGVSIADLQGAGVSLEELVSSGIPTSDLLAAGLAVGDLLAAGASVSDLLAVGISVQDLISAGANISDLLAAGIFEGELLDLGVELRDLIAAGGDLEVLLDLGFNRRELLSNGANPSELMALSQDLRDFLDEGISIRDLISFGAEPSDFYGLRHEGGLIFFIDQNSPRGLIAELEDVDFRSWGCAGINLPDLPDITSDPPSGSAAGIFDGEIVSNIIESNCGQESAAFSAIQAGGFLPSILELEEMNNNIGFNAPAPKTNIGNFDPIFYWSSTEESATNAWAIAGDSAPFLLDKTISGRVRPIRIFDF